jgi:hypothetical protein
VPAVAFFLVQSFIASMVQANSILYRKLIISTTQPSDDSESERRGLFQMKNGNQDVVSSLVEGSSSSSHFSSTEDLCQSFVAHKGYLTDKWEQYLPVYQSIFSFFKQRALPIRLLEVGVQNGGSLQLWSEYFLAGSEFFGIDINPACASLEVGHNVSILIGDASNPLILESLIGDAKFDIIIDDGSHKSDDIIATFLACFPRLKSGGGLHCRRPSL